MTSMEPNFQVETRHDSDAYNNMITVHYVRHQKNSIKALYALGVVLALFVWFISAGGNYASIRALGTGIFSLALILLAVPYVDRIAAKNVCRRMLRGAVKAAEKGDTYGLPTRYRFYEDHLDATDSAGCVESPYSKVTDLVETDGYYLLFLESGQCILARKTDFTVGTSKDFKPFISRCCGKEMAFFEMSWRNRR